MSSHHEHAEQHRPSDAELYDLHVFHRVDHDWIRSKFEALYGDVATHQDQLIARHVLGGSVLDAGAGYGWTTKGLRERGFDVTGIDLHDATRDYGRRWLGVDVLPGDVYQLDFPDRSFDTVLLRESGEHLDFSRAAPEAARVARRAVILFQTNVSPLVRAMRRIAGHHEYRSPPVAHYVTELERVGLSVDVVVYTDLFSFALSGGHVTRQWLPKMRPLYRAVIAADDALARIARAVRLDRVFAWRVLIRAVRDPEM